MADMDPDRPGLEVWQVHETPSANGGITASFRDAKTGQVFWSDGGSGDNGRGCCAPLVSGLKGWQMWSGRGGLWDVNHKNAGSMPSSDNFAIWWDGGLLRATENGTSISPYGGGAGLSASGCAACNGSKSTPCLTADVFGDWREEIIYSCGSQLRIYTTTASTTNRLYTLMHDPVYRMSVASENVAYNQPPEPGIYIGYGMTLPQTKPNIRYYGEVTARAPLKAFHGATPVNHSLKVFGNRTLALPVQWSGMQKLVTVYDFSGKVIRKAIVKSNSLNLQKDFGISDGLYIMQVNKIPAETIERAGKISVSN
jgi:rhamnogalacturonan endolyase